MGQGKVLGQGKVVEQGKVLRRRKLVEQLGQGRVVVDNVPGARRA